MTLTFNLKKMLDAYEGKTGVRVSYSQFAENIGVSLDTIKSLATRADYSPSLDLVSKVAEQVGLDPREYFEWEPDAQPS